MKTQLGNTRRLPHSRRSGGCALAALMLVACGGCSADSDQPVQADRSVGDDRDVAEHMTGIDASARSDAAARPDGARASAMTDGSSQPSFDSGPSRPFTDEQLVEQGCAPSRIGTVYRAGATTSVSEQKASTLLPCWSETGYGSSEVSLSVTRDGTVYLAPVYTQQGNGIAFSRDFGASWLTSIPSSPGVRPHGRFQPLMYLEPNTEHIFFSSSVMQAINAVDRGFDLSISRDGAETWEHSWVFGDSRDWLKMFAGAPASSTLNDYPVALYASVPTPITTTSAGIVPDPDYQTIHQSLDGGKTWTQVGSRQLTLKAALAASSGLAPSAVCPSWEYIIFGNGVVDEDGTLYVGYRLCTTLAVAVSRDEGRSWTSHTVPGSTLPGYEFLLSYLIKNNIIPSEPIAIDTEGNLYVVWNDATGLLRYSVSRDHGINWTSPVIISAPEVTATALSSIAVKKPGTIAVSYFGSLDGLKFNGYVAESTTALERETLWDTAIVNDPQKPLFSNGFDNNYIGVLYGGDLDEFIQVKYAPNGDIWSSFIRQMCVNMNPAACDWNLAEHTNSMLQAAAGRIVHR